MTEAAESTKRPQASLSDNVQGSLWILCAGVFASLLGATVKLVSAELSTFQIAFFRSFIAFLFVAPLMFRAGVLTTCQTSSISLHLLRAVIGYGAMLGIFFALANAPLANVTAITFTKALFVVVLAALVLRESVGWRRGLATMCGFAGVLVMVQPGAEGFDAYLLLAVAAAFCAASSNIILKKLTGRDSTLTILVLFSLLSSVISAIPAIIFWTWPTPWQWLLLVGIGLCGVMIQFCLVRGLRIGETTAIMPFDYFRLLFSGALGFLLFDTLPDIWAIAGAVIIVASTVYVAHGSARSGS